MLNKKLTRKILLPGIMALLLTFSAFVPAFASGGYVPIDKQHKEVESNNTEEEANIIPFNGKFNIVYGRYNYNGDEDNFIFACGEDKDIEFKFTPISRSSWTACFYIWVQDKLTGEVIHAEPIKELGKKEYINFKGEAGHNYVIFIGINCPEEEHINCSYSIVLRGK